MTGCDLVHIPRIAAKLADESSPLHKIFHPAEKAYCDSLSEKQKFASYAARFAAKEAFAKALGIGFYREGLRPEMVWVERLPSGKPVLKWDETVQTLIDKYNVCKNDVSMSHDGEYAVSFIILYGYSTSSEEENSAHRPF